LQKLAFGVHSCGSQVAPVALSLQYSLLKQVCIGVHARAVSLHFTTSLPSQVVSPGVQSVSWHWASTQTWPLAAQSWTVLLAEPCSLHTATLFAMQKLVAGGQTWGVQVAPGALSSQNSLGPQLSTRLC
jgi:hypothetical protein